MLTESIKLDKKITTKEEVAHDVSSNNSKAIFFQVSLGVRENTERNRLIELWVDELLNQAQAGNILWDIIQRATTVAILANHSTAIEQVLACKKLKKEKTAYKGFCISMINFSLTHEKFDLVSQILSYYPSIISSQIKVIVITYFAERNIGSKKLSDSGWNAIKALLARSTRFSKGYHSLTDNRNDSLVLRKIMYQAILFNDLAFIKQWVNTFCDTFINTNRIHSINHLLISYSNLWNMSRFFNSEAINELKKIAAQYATGSLIFAYLDKIYPSIIYEDAHNNITHHFFIIAAQNGNADIINYLSHYSSSGRPVRHISSHALNQALSAAGEKKHFNVIAAIIRTHKDSIGFDIDIWHALFNILGAQPRDTYNANISLLLSNLYVFRNALRHRHEHSYHTQEFILEKLRGLFGKNIEELLTDERELKLYSLCLNGIELAIQNTSRELLTEHHGLPEIYEDLRFEIAALHQSRDMQTYRAREYRIHALLVSTSNPTFERTLQDIANDPESSMRGLSEREKTQLQRVNNIYWPTILAEHPGHSNPTEAAFENMLDILKARYALNPISFQDSQGKTIPLPCKWNDFEALNLSNPDKKCALQCYYRHQLHTAIRYLLPRNDWMHPKASYTQEKTEIIDGEEVKYQHSDLEHGLFSYKPTILVLWRMMSDPNVPLINDYTLDSRIDAFIAGLARAGRTHNSDYGPDQFNEGDRPSCYSGANGYIFAAAQEGQSLLVLLTEDNIEAELQSFVTEHFGEVLSSLKPEDKDTLHTSWNNYISGEGKKPHNLNLLNLSQEKQEAFKQLVITLHGEDDGKLFLAYIGERFNANQGLHAETFAQCLTHHLPQPYDPYKNLTALWKKIRQNPQTDKLGFFGGEKRGSDKSTIKMPKTLAAIYGALKPYIATYDSDIKQVIEAKELTEEAEEALIEKIKTMLTSRLNASGFFSNSKTNAFYKELLAELNRMGTSVSEERKSECR